MDDQNKSMNEGWAAPAHVPERGYAGEEQPPDARTAEIRTEIEQTRGEMRETLEAIEDRLRPRRVVARAADSVREATVGRVRDAASSVRNSMRTRSGGGSYGIAERLRDNPVPATLAAASIVWLAFSGRRSNSDNMSPAIYGSTRDGDAFIRETRISHDVEDTGTDQDFGSGHSYADAASDAMQRARATTAEAASTLRRKTSQATSTLNRTTSQVQRRARHLTRENTLAAGAVAAAIGLAVGLALPATERENELMGEARDSMIGRAREAAKDAARRVQDAAGQVGSVAGLATDDSRRGE